MSTPYRHELRVRYGEVDMQRHVFNAHYLAYVDDAFDTWLRSTLGRDYESTFDMVLKRAEVTWHGGASIGYAGSVGEQPVFTAVVTYVSVAPGTTEPAPVPEAVRSALA